MTTVLILGSGPNVVAARSWARVPFDHILAINNAWAVRPDWDDLIHPEDFPVDRRPTELAPAQRIITAEDFVPAQNAFGGFVYAGGTMSFTAGYWALHALRPSVIAFLGCDMVYPKGPQTHFYGKGEPDPLRRDITLRSLEAKSARLMIEAADMDCAVVNLSTDPSRLIVPRSTPATLRHQRPAPFDRAAAARARAAESAADYMVPSGRYWLEEDRFDPAVIDRIDALWLAAAAQAARAA